jgi:hypothetical protein
MMLEGRFATAREPGTNRQTENQNANPPSPDNGESFLSSTGWVTRTGQHGRLRGVSLNLLLPRGLAVTTWPVRTTQSRVRQTGERPNKTSQGDEQCH